VRARLRERLEAQEEPQSLPHEPLSEEERERRFLREYADRLESEKLAWMRPLWEPYRHRWEDRLVTMGIWGYREEIGRIMAHPKVYVSPDNVVRLLEGWLESIGEYLVPGSWARYQAAQTPEERVAVLREVVRGAIPPYKGPPEEGWAWLLERWKRGEAEIEEQRRREAALPSWYCQLEEVKDASSV